VLAEDPVHPKATAALEDLYSRAKSWGELAALLDQGEEPARRRQGRDALPPREIYDDRLSDGAKAQLRFEEALVVEPRHLGALKGLEHLYARVGKFQELLLNLRTQFELAATPRQKIALLERIGGMQEEEFVDNEKAARPSRRSSRSIPVTTPRTQRSPASTGTCIASTISRSRSIATRRAAPTTSARSSSFYRP